MLAKLNQQTGQIVRPFSGLSNLLDVLSNQLYLFIKWVFLNLILQDRSSNTGEVNLIWSDQICLTRNSSSCRFHFLEPSW